VAVILPPYSDTFVSNHFTTLGAVDYTVPAGKVAVVDSVALVQGIGNVISYLVASVDLTGSGSFVLIWQSTFAAGANANARSSSYWQGRVVVRAGGKIRGQSLVTSDGYVTISGFLLTA